MYFFSQMYLIVLNYDFYFIFVIIRKSMVTVSMIILSVNHYCFCT